MSRYEIPAHRMPDGTLCPSSMTVTTMPKGCNTDRGQQHCHRGDNAPLADAAPSRLDVTYAVLRCLEYGEDMPADLSAEKVELHPYWDATGRVILRLDVTREGHTFTYSITVDGDL